MGHEELRFDDGQVSTILGTAADKFVSYTRYQELVESATKAGIPAEFVYEAVEDYLKGNVKPERKSLGELEKKAENLPTRLRWADKGLIIGMYGVISIFALSGVLEIIDSSHPFKEGAGLAVQFGILSTYIGYVAGYTKEYFSSGKK